MVDKKMGHLILSWVKKQEAEKAFYIVDYSFNYTNGIWINV